MPTPRLIHPIQVTVQILDRSSLLMDADAREPIHGARAVAAGSFTLPAQVSYETRDDPEPNAGGVRLNNTGYILCRPTDMDTYLGSGVRLKRGDRITAMGILTGLDLYIGKSDPMGHYPSTNGSSLMRYYFDDREPVSTNGG